MSIFVFRRSFCRAALAAFAGVFCLGTITARPVEITLRMMAGADFQGRGLARFATHDFVLSPQAEEIVNRGLAQLIASHQKTFGRKVSSGLQFRYRIFGRYEDYREYSARRYGIKVVRPLLGYFNPDTREIVTWRQQYSWMLPNVLLHEGSHAIMNDLFGALPLWMHEGSADWFGAPSLERIVPDAAKNRKERDWRQLMKWLEEGGLPDFKSYLVARDYADWEGMFKGDIAQGYLVGWSIFDFFMSHPQSSRFMAGLVNRPEVERSHYSAENFTNFLERQWPGGLVMFERGWTNYIKLKNGADPRQLSRGR